MSRGRNPPMADRVVNVKFHWSQAYRAQLGLFREYKARQSADSAQVTLQNAGYDMPARHPSINFASADLPKDC